MLALRARIREDIEKAETDSNLRNYETEVVDQLVEQALSSTRPDGRAQIDQSSKTRRTSTRATRRRSSSTYSA